MSEYTYNRIKKFGKMGESFDQVLSRVLAATEENQI